MKGRLHRLIETYLRNRTVGGILDSERVALAVLVAGAEIADEIAKARRRATAGVIATIAVLAALLRSLS